MAHWEKKVFQVTCENLNQNHACSPELYHWALSLVRTIGSSARGKRRLKKMQTTLTPLVNLIEHQLQNLFNQPTSDPRFSCKDECMQAASQVNAYLVLLQNESNFGKQFIVDLIQNLDKVFGIQKNLVQPIFPFFNKEFENFFHFACEKLSPKEQNHETIQHVLSHLEERSILN